MDRGYGVVAMITNNSFLMGSLHRLMREHLIRSFDRIVVLNLHGDIRNDFADGPDQNVFEITQGVAISIFVRSEVRGCDTIEYKEFTGSAQSKYDRLWESVFSQQNALLEPREPNFLFLPFDGIREEYETGFPLNALFPTYSSGIQTKRDGICVQADVDALRTTLDDFKKMEADALRRKYNLPKDGRDWTIAGAKKDVKADDGSIQPIMYRVLDSQFTYYTGRSRAFLGYPRREVMQHIVGHRNFGLIFNRQTAKEYFSFAFVADKLINHGTFYLGNRGQDYFAPLYRYPLSDEQPDAFQDSIRTPNLNPKLYTAICAAAGIDPADQAGPDDDFRAPTGEARPSEVKVFDYIYGVLHSPDYRGTFAEFLKIDFPRVP